MGTMKKKKGGGKKTTLINMCKDVGLEIWVALIYVSNALLAVVRCAGRSSKKVPSICGRDVIALVRINYT